MSEASLREYHQVPLERSIHRLDECTADVHHNSLETNAVLRDCRAHLLLLVAGSSQHEIEDVEVTLSLRSVHQTNLLQEECPLYRGEGRGSGSGEQKSSNTHTHTHTHWGTVQKGQRNDLALTKSAAQAERNLSAQSTKPPAPRLLHCGLRRLAFLPAPSFRPLPDPHPIPASHLMAAPMRKPSLSKSIWMNLPNLEELSLRTVRAFPNASRMGLLCNTCSIQTGAKFMRAHVRRSRNTLFIRIISWV